MSEVRQAMDRQKNLREEKEKLEKQQQEEKLSVKAAEELAKLSPEEKIVIVPENNLAKVGSGTHDRMVLAKLKERFNGD